MIKCGKVAQNTVIHMLMEKLKADAGEAVFEKAASHYKSAAVKSYAYNHQGDNRYQIKAIVKASGAYGVNLNLDCNFNRLKIDHYCTCSAGGSRLCEHATAVVYKFLADDFPKLSPSISKPASLDGIELLKMVAAATLEKSALYYAIGGLDNQAGDFQIAFNGPDRDKTFIYELVKCLGDVNYSPRKRELLFNSLNRFDHLIISYLEHSFTGKDSGLKSISLPKSKENLEMILVLIENGRALSADTSKTLKLGLNLKPRVYLTGTETRLQFTFDLAEFEQAGFLDRDLNYLLANDTLHIIDTSGLEKLPPEITITPEELGRVLFEILPRLSEKVHLESAPEFHSHVLLLRQPEIGLFFDYYPEEVSCRPEVKIQNQVYRGRDCWRLLTEETSYDRSPTNPRQWFSINRQPLKELGRFFEQNKFEFAADSWLLKERGDLLKFMLNGLQQLPAEWLVTTSPAFAAFKIAPVKLEPQVHVELDGKIDWFDFEIYYNLGGVTYTQREIQAMIRRTGSGNYILAGDQWFFIEEAAKMELLERNLPPDKTGTGPTREKRFNLVFFRQLLQEQGITIQGNAVYDQFEADISGANLVKDVPLPETLRGELRPYQKEGFNWLRFLHKYRFGGILADDMGLGKTIQALTLIKSLPKEEPSLVVCPRSLVYNWAAEVDRFYPGTARLVYHGPPETRERLRSSFQDQEIIITTYDIVVNDIEALQNYFFYYCILDEAQQIKNQQTQRAKECKKITARHRLVLTGTPVENRLEDLWSLFDFLLPDYLGNQNEFKEKYVTPLKKPGNQGSLDLLKRKIAPFMLRRRKEDVLAELPPKIITQRNVLMTQLQEDVYRAILKEVQQEVLSSVSNFGLEKSRLTVLSALTKLRQLCDHPSLAVPEVSPEVDSGKIEALMELILEAVAGGHKIVVFSQFVRMLKLIRLKFQENRLNYVYLDGSTTDRQERIDCFNSNPDIPVFLISLKAGGVGINLTAADIVIQVDPWWNPMVEEQATDRVHRIGQQKQVLVYKLVTAGTVEEKLVLLQQRKKALFDAVFKDYNAPVNSLTWEDIKELLEINE